MLRWFVILSSPAILLLAWIKLAQHVADARIFNVDGMTWNTHAGAVRARTSTSPSPDDVAVETVRLQLMDGSGRSLYQDDVRVDWDLWGWGFVKAMQMDADPELEVVSMNYADFRRYARGEPPQHAYILDLSSGQVQKSADFSHAPKGFYWLLFAWEGGYKSMWEGMIIVINLVMLLLMALLLGLSAVSRTLRRTK